MRYAAAVWWYLPLEPDVQKWSKKCTDSEKPGKDSVRNTCVRVINYNCTKRGHKGIFQNFQ